MARFWDGLLLLLYDGIRLGLLFYIVVQFVRLTLWSVRH